jgi:hypothetical protein
LNNQTMEQLLRHRLGQATQAELARICVHLSIDEGSALKKVENVFLNAADNTIINVVRPVISSDQPTYSQILRLIYKELRSYSEGLDETWKAVKSIEFWNYKSPIEDMSNDELEDKIFEMYAAEYSDAQKKLVSDPSLWNKVASYLPSVTGAAVSTTVTVTSVTATRLPFAAIAPGAVAGPVGIALAVVMMGVQASGPAFRKIVPASVELILIGRRIQYMPED